LAESRERRRARKRLATIPRHEYEGRAVFAEEKLSRLVRAAASFLFPSRCLACRSRPVERFLRGGVCEGCWESLPHPAAARCDLCDEALAAPSPDISRCGRCLLSPPPFRRLRAAAPYSGSAREILMAFKFGGADFLAPRLAKVLTDRLGTAAPADAVTAVPATARARRRGDHAADLLGAALSARLGVAFDARRLEKVRPTERQSGLPLARRAENVRGAFQARPGAPRRVLLVDDVATSGATVRECARRLLLAGAREVEVWCFARASRDEWLSADRTRRAPAP
jgi:ComF family protein